jgi:hypothetical protein
MKSVTLDEARGKFESLFNLASQGELIVVTRNNEKVMLRSMSTISELEIAPPGHFANDYDAQEIAELNSLAALGPKSPIP